MNKDELIEKVKELEDKVKSLNSNNTYLLKQQNEYKKMAEDAGSEIAKWKHKYIRQEEELNKVRALENKNTQ
jgi:uncharacterized coiled-coil DUF342 family protein